MLSGKVAFPVEIDNGLDSYVYGHFGSAPMFVVVDIDSKSTILINNSEEHEHGQCNPVRNFASTKIDAIVTGGIGSGAIMKLNNAGIKVYRTNVAGKISDLLNDTSKLELLDPSSGCSHGHNH
ncbi:MAG: NifB/NifX family molybdenum-iron cluster-binding protein [Candidatus Delongbacteria bacterium]|nr:NifB/NifX family molybdenum-iron cluster-binding protein [Candidatus Delongbacteria bacterium]MBN2833551.1 NifB/NifX family molybdenum-iron cluster-binding protein [Candidatus Delongbacteria bacterium]